MKRSEIRTHKDFLEHFTHADRALLDLMRADEAAAIKAQNDAARGTREDVQTRHAETLPDAGNTAHALARSRHGADTAQTPAATPLDGQNPDMTEDGQNLEMMEDGQNPETHPLAGSLEAPAARDDNPVGRTETQSEQTGGAAPEDETRTAPPGVQSWWPTRFRTSPDPEDDAHHADEHQEAATPAAGRTVDPPRRPRRHRRRWVPKWATIRARLTPRRLVAAITLGGICLLAGVGMRILLVDPPPPGDARIAGNPGLLNPTPGGDTQARSPDYQATVEDSNDQETQRASETGETFIPVPESVPQLVGTLAEPAESGTGGLAGAAIPPLPAGPPPPPSPAEDPASAWTVTPPPGLPPVTVVDQANPFGDAVDAIPSPVNPMLAYLEALAARPHPVMEGQRFPPPAPAEGPHATGAGLPPGAPVALPDGFPVPASPSADLFQALGLLPGDLFDAAMINSLNSDLPGPAIAEITEGNLAGARAVGVFAPRFESGGLALTFDHVFLPDGRSFPIAGYGLSPWTGESLTRSRLDPRFIRRIGVPAFLGLLSGAATAITTGAAQRVVVRNDNIIVERDTPGEREILAAGIAAGARAAATLAAGTTPATPKIQLAAGSPIVLLLAPAPNAPSPTAPLSASGRPPLPTVPGPAGAATSILLPALLGDLPPQDLSPP